VSEARVVTEVEYTVDVAIEADEDARAVEQVRIYFTLIKSIPASLCQTKLQIALQYQTARAFFCLAVSG
jgi:hypothetical protein